MNGRPVNGMGESVTQHQMQHHLRDQLHRENIDAEWNAASVRAYTHLSLV